MNTKTEQLKNTESQSSNFATACLSSCLKVMEQITRVKQIVLDEFHELVEAHQKLLRLAVNEAEALAYATDYPHLVFPALAEEKAQQVAAWEARQQVIAGHARRGVQLQAVRA